MSSMNAVRVLTIATACALTGSIGGPAAAQCAPAAAAGTSSTATPPPESTPVTPVPPSPGPLVFNWTFGNGAGHANVTCTSDGACLFSGHYDNHRPGKDIDIAMAVKSSSGATLVFHFVGDVGNGASWTKNEQTGVLKDDWTSFSKDRRWTGSVHFYETAAGRRAEYEARERKRADLLRLIDGAIKRHDEQTAREKKAELEQQEQQEAAQEQARAQQPQSNSGGSSFGSVMGTIGSVAGSILACL